MAYDASGLFAKLCEVLAKAPRASLSVVSDSLSVERHTVERVVKRFTKQSFSNLRSRLLAERARQLLCAHPELSVKQVAAQLGCSSSQDLSRAIARVYGTTPSRIRQTQLTTRTDFGVSAIR